MPSKNMHHAKTGPIQLFNFNFYLFAGGFIYILSPLNLIFALNVPFLLNFLILNTALPFLLILAL